MTHSARRAALLALVAGFLLSCPTEERGAAPGSRQRGETADRGPAEVGVAPRMAPRPALRPDELLAPRWPDDWRIADASAAGPRSLPVLTWRIDAPQAGPLQAASAALDALRPLAGEIEFEDVREENGPGEEAPAAVGQIRGSRLRAGILSVQRRGSCEVTITAELLPGGTAPPS